MLPAGDDEKKESTLGEVVEKIDFLGEKLDKLVGVLLAQATKGGDNKGVTAKESMDGERSGTYCLPSCLPACLLAFLHATLLTCLTCTRLLSYICTI